MHNPLIVCLIIFYRVTLNNVISQNYGYINLPDKHLPFYFNKFSHVARDCRSSVNCEYREFLENYNQQKGEEVCWGYERDCTQQRSFSQPTCLGDHEGWVKDKSTQIDTFYTQADFGEFRKKIKSSIVLLLLI